MTSQKQPSKKEEPTIAVGLEMDELEAKATKQEVAKGDYTPVTKLFLDRTE
ncbi:hypothetical protein [Brevibacillus fulvus]|uniref:Uncharacterized protein n=1 Tax=Brevibacillus fulvus TaxID=1125967 RepID=A0A938XX12_9BACL|nr:hypothetical protein [Brevibacillus fulvus]MBM7589250.1 hypothetical protein [Brevibacillus fulvus]